MLMPAARYLLALLAGVVTVFSFAPIGIFPLAILGLATLFILLGSNQPHHPFLTGWLFGLGLFGMGVSWIYISLHVYGDMPAVLSVIATVLFCSFLALFPAWFGSLQAKIKSGMALRLLIIMPTLWTLLEWGRSWIFTGFPWLSVGYSQVPSSPLDGYAPVLGVFGVSLVLAVSAGTLAWIWVSRAKLRNVLTGLMLLTAIFGGGFLLKKIDWTQPEGAPFSVALIQGNIPQEMKWDPEAITSTLQSYEELARTNPAKLTVMPEAALPLFYNELPESYLDQLRTIGRKHGGDILTGVLTGSLSGPYMNSVASFGLQPTQFYSKHHLVPFGEFVPPGFDWANTVLHIPMSDFSRGSPDQPPFNVAGQHVAVDICYEDAFGEEIIRALPQATLLVNVSDDAWFGNSFAARQHRQISQMRALETGRMMLRATNTGSTAIIDNRGRVLEEMPLFKRGVLKGIAQGYSGQTPYVRWGNWPIVIASGLFLLLAAWLGIRKRD
jgi:apolipoprotein N-acyltransferase